MGIDELPPDLKHLLPAHALGDGSIVLGSGILLSARDRTLLELLAAGLTYRQIGAQLSIAVSTVKSALARLREKTGLSRARLIVLHGYFREFLLES